MESLTDSIMTLIHERETALQNELKTIEETKRLWQKQPGVQGAPGVTHASANGAVAQADAIPEVSRGWSVARRQRHSRMMKKRWAARKRAKQSKQ